MPARAVENMTKYDFMAWRGRTRLSQNEAATMLGISTTKLWRAERDGVASKELAWACYGIECFMRENENAKRIAAG